MKKKLIIGTRGSKLALWQANYVADSLRALHADLVVEINKFVTTGDKILDVPLAKIGGKGLFTKELEVAMLAGDIDLAVHSLKDMPTVLPKGLTLAAVLKREEVYDALICPQFKTLDKLPPGAVIGTSSLRRRAQLAHYRPDVVLVDLRGNLDTRLKKLSTEGIDGIILAAAGLKRLGWEEHITEMLPLNICLPAVGQGALAIETRSNDAATQALVAPLNHVKTQQAVTAERAFLGLLEGGCQVPIGVYAQVQGETLSLEAVILSVDGRRVVRDTITGQASAAAELGQRLAKKMYAAGGASILADLCER